MATCRMAATHAALVLGATAYVAAALAAPAQAARAWRDPIRVSPADIEASSGTMAVTARDETVALWTESPPGIVPELRWAAKPRGGAFGAAVAPTPGAGTFWPVMATDGLGGTLAAWEHEPKTGGTPGVVGSRQRILAAYRPPGGAFGPPQDIGQGQGGIALDANARGDAAVIFVRYDHTTGTRRMWGAVRPAAGVFGAPQPLSGPIPDVRITGAQDVAMTSAGEAVFAWTEETPTGLSQLRATTMTVLGAPAPAQLLSDPSTSAGLPYAGADGQGEAVVTWVEGPGDRDTGEVQAARRPAGGPFLPAIALGGTTARETGAEVAAGADGTTLVAWTTVHSSEGGGRQMGDLRGVVADGAAGQFGPPRDVATDPADQYLALDVAADGDAIVLYGASEREVHAVRLPKGGDFGPVENLACPAPLALPIAAELADDGRAAVYWKVVDTLEPVRGFFLSEDEEAAQPGPGPCPPRPPSLSIAPNPAAPGQVVRFDGSGARIQTAEVNQWSWDLDGDGSYEIPLGENPVMERSFPSPGEYRIRMRHTFRQGGNAGDDIYERSVTVRVPEGGGSTSGNPGSTSGSGGPSSGAGSSTGASSGGSAGASTGNASTTSGTTTTTGTAAGTTGGTSGGLGTTGPPTAPADPGSVGSVAIAVPSGIRARTVARSGLPVRLRADRDGLVRVRLWLVTRRARGSRARFARRLSLAAEDRLVRAGRVRRFRVVAGARGRRALRRARRGTLVLEVVPHHPRVLAAARRTIRLRG